MTTKLILFRHGLPEGKDRFRGAGDWGITHQGMVDMMKRSGKLPHVDTILCSPLTRCRSFAHWYSHKHDIPLTVEAKLTERFYGDWDGKDKQEVEMESPELYAEYMDDEFLFTPPNGEHHNDYTSRLRKVLTETLKRNKNQTTLMVLHGGIIRFFVKELWRLAGNDPKLFVVPYATFVTITITDDSNGSHYHLDYNARGQINDNN